MSALTKLDRRVLYEVYLGKYTEFNGDRRRQLLRLHRKGLITRQNTLGRVHLGLTDAGRAELEAPDA